MTIHSSKIIGGYFGLELTEQHDYFKYGLALNTGTNCLKYLIKEYQIKEIYVPYYTCSAIIQAIKSEQCDIIFYHIDETFMPTIDFDINKYILYTNYFGISANNVTLLALKYKNIIIDNAQAFYMPQRGFASFNSIRKFFGVPDGAMLQCDKFDITNIEKSSAYQKSSHLLKRIDISPQFGYKDFKHNECNLNKENIKLISNLSKSILNSIDVSNAKHIRLKNFAFLHSKLGNSNLLNINIGKYDVPMIYPYFINNGKKLKEKLIKNNIFVSTYWQTATNLNKQEANFRNNIVALPIDQRYGVEDMQYILDVINER